MTIMVFWLKDGNPQSKLFEHDQLVFALQKAEELRRAGARHVCISSEHPDCVTKAGVDAVTDGKTPDGESYNWKKRRL